MLWFALSAGLFVLGFAALGYSYVVYPWLLEHWYRKRFAGGDPLLMPDDERVPRSMDGADLPPVGIVFAAYNEEAVLPGKLESMRQLRYPKEKLSIWIGSDGSTDLTDALVREAAAEGMPIRLLRLEGRNGKASVLNALKNALDQEAEPPELLMLTDANIVYDPDVLLAMVAHFEDPDMGLVGAVVKHPEGLGQEGIARQEGAYIARENRLKHREGALWGAMMGAFGACYMVRRSDFPELPPQYLMEDFYASMQQLAFGRKAILEPHAVCYEDLPDAVGQEFRRKVRISAGNLQNLFHWSALLWPPTRVGFVFWSHKVLRWLGPLWMLAMMLGAIALTLNDSRWMWLLILQVLLWLSPVLDALARRLKVHWPLLRLIGYFCSMNAALFVGFVWYWKGIRSTAWQPPTRRSHSPQS
jgi:cellulose synthase/poly-beta-1,6-N-acetylglucosamine synthase-like glycosyltransferase